MAPELEIEQRTLRPTAEQAAAAWSALVTAEKRQVESLPDRPRPEDFYAPVASAFQADPRRNDEPLLDRLRALVHRDETWIDIGAGGGRYTLPIALLARRVFAVEPSEGMRNALRESARLHGIENVDIFDERWPGPSRAPVADTAFISQVGYDIAEMGAFLDAMEAHAASRCVAVLFDHAPISEFGPLWAAVHGEERVLLPGLGEFMTLLFARGRTPELSVLSLPPRSYESLDALIQAARRPLWVLPGTTMDERLKHAVSNMALQADGMVMLSGRERRLGIVTWRPRD